jgi:hypothetical protein
LIFCQVFFLQISARTITHVLPTVDRAANFARRQISRLSNFQAAASAAAGFQIFMQLES